jgi:lipoprotein-anchoring transpeptidase ErfK/SrfK
MIMITLAVLLQAGTIAAPPPASSPKDRALQLQVLLDRAHFSPGTIDGVTGGNVDRALAAYARSREMDAARAEAALRADAVPPLVSYTITAEDAAGPYVVIPADMLDKAKLERLGFSSALEALGERFHASPALLQRLNPGARFDTAGTEIQVPNVNRDPLPKVASVVVDESDRSVIAKDEGGRVLARYPATMGSEHDPLPLGTWKINGVQRNPPFFYNAKLFWDADEKQAKAKIAPGPNNPVGTVWIDLSKPHYGIHGTPEPATIGKTESHGCIRLTNWDADELAAAVSPGVPAVLQQ